jgi:hypothetical protein
MDATTSPMPDADSVEVVIPLTGEGDIARLLDLHADLDAMRPRVDKLGADPDRYLHLLMCSVQEKIGSRAFYEAQRLRAAESSPPSDRSQA